MPRSFALPESKADLWTPLVLAHNGPDSEGRYLSVIARLKPHVTLAQAQQDVAAIARQLEAERPAMDKHWSAEVVPLLADLTAGVRLPLLVLLAAVGFVLLIACANVANLLLVRGTGRLREVAVRSALGASRGRVIAQLLTESLLLALIACAAGLALAHASLRALLAALPDDKQLPRMASIHLDARIAIFAVALSIATVILFGLAPAIHVSRLDVQEGLRQGSARTGVGGNRRLRHSFVVLEVSLALLLLVGAGLMVRSFVRLISVRPGFQPEHVLTMRIFTSPGKYSDDRKRSQYVQHVLDEIRALPAVEAAGSIHFLPLTESMSGSCWAEAGGPPLTPSESPDANFLIISPGYFSAMRTPLLRGRDFSEQDRFGSHGVAIVNRAFEQRFFPHQDVLGKRINVCWDVVTSAEIVGVVADARQTELATAPQPTIFLDNAQAPMYFATLVVRTRTEPGPMARAVERAIQHVDPDQPVSDVRTMDEVLSDSVAQPRFQLLLLLVFSCIAVLLATVGVYAVLAYSVAQRTQEIGVRVALGARHHDVLALVVREGLSLVALGITFGLAAALVLTRILRSLLFEVTPTDPLTLVLVPCFVLAVAFAATLLPARRAASLSPVTALRVE
jgi:putative ABC transport system permease protein